MFKKFVALLSLVSLVSLLSLSSPAQQPKQVDKPLEKTASKKTEPPAADKKDQTPPVVVIRSQLPRGWKALNLSDKQKKAIYSTRAQFAAKRQALLDQLERLKEEESEALNKLLTDAQRQQLATLKK
jgi:hypothetical protein